MKYDASRCRFVRTFLYDYCEPLFKTLIPIIVQLLMPWKRGGLNLFVFDREEKTLTVLDPTPIPDWCKDIPYKRYVHRIINVSNSYRRAMGVDVFQWKHILPSSIPVIEERYLHLKHLLLCFI
jgi:hypothetical protein